MSKETQGERQQVYLKPFAKLQPKLEQTKVEFIDGKMINRNKPNTISEMEA